MKKRKRFYLALGAFAALALALDQWTKCLVLRHLEPGQSLGSILGIFHITHTKNDGAAWGMLSGQTWLFVLVMLAFLALLGLMVWKKWLSHPFEWCCLAAIAAGGLGNMIDRLLYGQVTDMICLDFMDFPVFNVADCFITCGCIALAVYVVFFDRGDKRPQPPGDGPSRET